MPESAEAILDELREQFREKFDTGAGLIVRAPGRVNLIGEHTDYNDGFVLPMAIDRALWMAIRPRTDRVVHLHALDFGDEIHFSLDSFTRADAGPAEYVKGVAWALRGAGFKLSGFEGVIHGSVPVGAGLSSSAALEIAAARAFAAVSDLAWDAKQMAKLAQQAENDWVGVNCGIMDQMISAAGQAGHALLIDCRTLEVEPAPLPDGTAVVVMDTGTRRGLVDSAYNERRARCESAAAAFGVKALRDVTPEMFEAHAGVLDSVTRRRARHVITENLRTLQASRAMRQGDAATLGDLMQASHISLRDDFEVSSPALDTMTAIALDHDACYGARMTGAGFGGCAVALVEREGAADFAGYVDRAYRRRSGHEPQLYICQASPGASIGHAFFDQN